MLTFSPLDEGPELDLDAPDLSCSESYSSVWDESLPELD